MALLNSPKVARLACIVTGRDVASRDVFDLERRGSVDLDALVKPTPTHNLDRPKGRAPESPGELYPFTDEFDRIMVGRNIAAVRRPKSERLTRLSRWISQKSRAFPLPRERLALHLMSKIGVGTAVL